MSTVFIAVFRLQLIQPYKSSGILLLYNRSTLWLLSTVQNLLPENLIPVFRQDFSRLPLHCCGLPYHQ